MKNLLKHEFHISGIAFIVSKEFIFLTIMEGLFVIFLSSDGIPNRSQFSSPGSDFIPVQLSSRVSEEAGKSRCISRVTLAIWQGNFLTFVPFKWRASNFTSGSRVGISCSSEQSVSRSCLRLVRFVIVCICKELISVLDKSKTSRFVSLSNCRVVCNSQPLRESSLRLV